MRTFFWIAGGVASVLLWAAMRPLLLVVYLGFAIFLAVWGMRTIVRSARLRRLRSTAGKEGEHQVLRGHHMRLGSYVRCQSCGWMTVAGTKASDEVNLLVWQRAAAHATGEAPEPGALHYQPIQGLGD